jgi:hypothetical protein
MAALLKEFFLPNVVLGRKMEVSKYQDDLWSRGVMSPKQLLSLVSS